MRNVLLPVYDRNNIPLDSFRNAAFLYEGQHLTLHEASILCFCIGASLQVDQETLFTFLFQDSNGVSCGCTRIMMEHSLYKRSCKLCQTSNSFFQGVTCAL